MKAFLPVLILLLTFGCAHKFKRHSKQPETINIIEEERKLISARPGSDFSTYGTYLGENQPFVFTRLVSNPDEKKIKSKSKVVSCFLSFGNKTRFGENEGYNHRIKIDITNIEKFKRGQQITLPHKNINVIMNIEISYDKLNIPNDVPVKGVIRFEEISKTKIVASMLLYREDKYIPDPYISSNRRLIVDIADVEFLPENLFNYAMDYSSFSAKNQAAREELFSVFPKGFVIFSDSIERTTEPQKVQEKIYQIRTQLDKPQFPGGLDSLSDFFNKRLPCPEAILQIAQPTTIYIYLSIDRNGKVNYGNVGFEHAFGNPHVSPLDIAELTSEDYSLRKRDIALLRYERKIELILPNLPPFKVAGPASLKKYGISERDLEEYKFTFPVILNCEGRK